MYAVTIDALHADPLRALKPTVMPSRRWLMPLANGCSAIGGGYLIERCEGCCHGREATSPRRHPSSTLTARNQLCRNDFRVHTVYFDGGR